MSSVNGRVQCKHNVRLLTAVQRGRGLGRLVRRLHLLHYSHCSHMFTLYTSVDRWRRACLTNGGVDLIGWRILQRTCTVQCERRLLTAVQKGRGLGRLVWRPWLLCYSQQFCRWSSSLPSLQSRFPSQTSVEGIQLPSPQRNSLGPHIVTMSPVATVESVVNTNNLRHTVT